MCSEQVPFMFYRLQEIVDYVPNIFHFYTNHDGADCLSDIQLMTVVRYDPFIIEQCNLPDCMNDLGEFPLYSTGSYKAR